MNIIDHILKFEGGLVNDPDDKGGLTKYGISQRAYPDEDIENLSEDRARYLLERDYVDGPGFHQLPPSQLKDQLIDFGYHSGPKRAILTLQKLLGVTEDGILGPHTLAAIRRHPNLLRLNNDLAIARMLFLVGICQRDRSQIHFLKGWGKRALSFIV